MVKQETGLTPQQIVSQLTKSPHGALGEYLPVGRQAVQEDADFFSHLVAWNAAHGQVKDAKVALPMIALSGARDRELAENALAHLALLDPRLFLRAMEFSRDVPGVPKRTLRRLVERYLAERRQDAVTFDNAVKQHRAPLKRLHALYHVPIVHNDRARAVLFDRKDQPRFNEHVKSGVLWAIRELPKMTPQLAGDSIVRYRIPFLVAKAQLGKKLSDPDLLLAVIKQMSPAELVTEMKLLEKLGVRSNPATRAALETALEAIATSKKTSTLKTSRAVDVLKQTDTGLAQKMSRVQEAQLDRLGNVDGDWLVLGDMSSSMSQSIEMAQQLAAVLTRSVKGKVHLVYFNSMPRYVDATGKTYDELRAQRVSASGMTSIGCGLAYILDRGIVVNGIAIVTDGGENTAPFFSQVYPKYAEKMGVDPPVYVFDVQGDPNSLIDNCRRTGIDVQVLLERKAKVDYYSLPNLVMTMRAERYALTDEIMATPLKSLNDVLTKTLTMEVLRESHSVAQAAR